MGRLDGKVAFITGAARGQGRSHAVRLAEEGADIVAIDINDTIDTVFYPMATEADLEQTVKLVEATDRRILARTADVRSQAALDAVVAEAISEFGHIDIVAANAGISTTMGRAWEISEADWQDVVDVNLTGVWHTVKAAIPAMIDGGRGGSIILTSSLGGLKGYSHLHGYIAAKHGVLGLMRTLANELGPYNIRCNAVCPGLINTDLMMNQPTYDIFRPELDGKATKEDATEIFKTWQVLPIDWLEPVDVSNVILWLASDESRYITGEDIVIDAGQIGRA